MAGQNTSNSTAFIEAEQYSKFILENLHDGMLPDGLTRDVSDFGTGTTLNIKTVGTRTIQDVQEGVAMTFNPIDSGTVTLTITDYIGDAWSVSDELREDGSQIDQLSAASAMESTRAIQENIETKFLIACANAQTANSQNLVNGFAHRFYGGGASKQVELMDFAYMKLAFDKANVPVAGRIMFVDPIVEMTLNSLVAVTSIANNPMFEGHLTEGFSREHKFIKNIFGFDIYTSNRLALTTGDLTNVTDRDGGAVTGAAGEVLSIAMCVADDNCKPIMRAWRRQPSVEGWRESEMREDRYQTSARFGFGAQRVDTLGVLITSASAY
jgi:hypothetical protein